MTTRLDTLEGALKAALGAGIRELVRDRGEIAVTVSSADYLAAARTLRDHAQLRFEQLIDLCGMDYSAWRNEPWEGRRFCVASQLLSVSLNWRVRLAASPPVAGNSAARVRSAV